jgi:membrane associated rhomboid family serine protease
MFLLPYRMETTFLRYPYTNVVIITVTCLFHFLVQFEIVQPDVAEAMVLRDWNMGQMIGNVFLHGGILHLLGNMLFLWIFGNAVCALVGNFSYIFIYLLLGILASASHLFFSGYPAIGASGAINGIVGLTLVFFPVNKLHNFYLLTWPFSFPHFFKAGKFQLKTFWMILYWFAFDILGAVMGGGHIAYWAHIGGFLAGVTVGVVLLSFKVFDTFDTTLFDVLSGNVSEHETRTLEEINEKKYGEYTPNPFGEEEIETTRAGEPEPDPFAIFQTNGNAPKEISAPTPDPFDEFRISPPAVETPAPVLPAAADHFGADPVPAFRLMKTNRMNGNIFCYFINEGDALSNVSLHSEIPGEIQPLNIKPKTPGWIKFSTTQDIVPEQIPLTITFDGAAGRITKQLTYNGESKKYIVAE